MARLSSWKRSSCLLSQSLRSSEICLFIISFSIAIIFLGEVGGGGKRRDEEAGGIEEGAELACKKVRVKGVCGGMAVG